LCPQYLSSSSGNTSANTSFGSSLPPRRSTPSVTSTNSTTTTTTTAANTTGSTLNTSSNSTSSPSKLASSNGNYHHTAQLLEGKQFFKKAKLELPYDSFNTFLSCIKRFNGKLATKEETLKTVRSIFGEEHEELYFNFETILDRSTGSEIVH
jgi:hypothetical protein